MTAPKKPTPRKTPAKKGAAAPGKKAILPKAIDETIDTRKAKPATLEQKAQEMLAKMVQTPWETWKASAGAIEELCDYIVQGGHMNAFAQHRGFSYTSMLRWLNAKSERAEMYAHAREERSHLLVDEMVSIADELHYEPVKNDEGVTVAVVIDKTAIAQAKLRIETRQWYAGRMHSKYKDKSEVNHKLGFKDTSDEALLKALSDAGVEGVSLVPTIPQEA